MSIGILALAIGVVLIAVSAMGIGNVDKPVKEDRRIEYPFPKEI